MRWLQQAKVQLSRKPIIFIPFVLGAVFIFLMIFHYGVNTPSWDQWEMVPIFQKIGNHTISVGDFWHQHNEHRIFFPLLILTASAYITHWNTNAELMINLIFAIGSATLLALFLRRSLKAGWVATVAASLTAAWFFSPVQWENWLWGWQVEWFLCVAAFLLMTFLLTWSLEVHDGNKKTALLTLAGLSAVVGSYSLASGVLAWFVGLLILLVGRQKRKVVIAWVVAAVLSTLLYYYHYVPVASPNGSPASFAIHNPLQFVEFFVVYLGGFVGSAKNTIYTAGLVGSLLTMALLPLLYLTWLRRKDVRVYLPWLAMILFVALAAFSTAFGRLGYGITLSLNSRYTAFSLLYVIGITGLGFTLLAHTKKVSATTMVVSVWSIVLISLPLLAASYAVGFRGFTDHTKLLKTIQICTHEAVPTDGCLLTTYPSMEVVAPRLEYLKVKHWAGF